MLIDPQHGAEHLAEIGEIDPNGGAGRLTRQCLIEVEDRVAVGHQILEHGLAELAATTGHQNSRHHHPPTFFAVQTTRCTLLRKSAGSEGGDAWRSRAELR